MVRDKDEYMPESLYGGERRNQTELGKEVLGMTGVSRGKLLGGLLAVAVSGPLLGSLGGELIWNISRIDNQKPNIEVIASSPESYASAIGKNLDKDYLTKRVYALGLVKCKSTLSHLTDIHFSNVEVITAYNSNGIFCSGEALIPKDK